jgi:hypothetical protein
LRAQIARLNYSLEASHQRVVELSAAMNIEPSIPGSPRLMSPRIPTLNGPRTPVHGLMGLPEAEGSTPGNEWLPPHSPIEEDTQAESREAGEDQQLGDHSGKDTRCGAHTGWSPGFESWVLLPTLGVRHLTSQVYQSLPSPMRPLSLPTPRFHPPPRSPALPAAGR